jgi:hypothetical protein
MAAVRGSQPLDFRPQYLALINLFVAAGLVLEALLFLKLTSSELLRLPDLG